MARTFTLNYKLHGLSSKISQELDTQKNYGFKNFDAELFELLGDSNVMDVRQSLVENILHRAKKIN